MYFAVGENTGHVYFKAVTDAVNGVLYHDDGQIVVMAGQKLYSLNPRTEIEIDELEGVI